MKILPQVDVICSILIQISWNLNLARGLGTCTWVVPPNDLVPGTQVITWDFGEVTDKFQDFLLNGHRGAQCMNFRITSVQSSNLSDIMEFIQLIRVARKTVTLNALDRPLVEDWVSSIHRNFGMVFMDDLEGQAIPILGVNGLKNQHLRIIYAAIWPYVTDHDQKGRIGTDIDMFKALEQKYDFQTSMEYRTSLGKTTLENGTSLGYFHQVSTRYSDLGIGQVTASYERWQIVDFGREMHLRELGFSSMATPRVDKLDTLFLPLDVPSWIMSLICVLSVFLLLLAMDYLHIHRFNGQAMNDTWAITISVLIQASQPARMLRKTRFRARFYTVSFWILSGFVMCMFYKSNLLATITIVAFQKPVDTPQEILKSELTVYAHGNSFIANGLRDSPLPIFQRIYEEAVVNRGGLIINSNISNPELAEIVGRGDGIQCEPRIRSQSVPKRRFHSVPYFVGSASWIFSKESQLKNIFDKDILRFHESGIPNYLRGNYEHVRNLENRVYDGEESQSKVEYGKIDFRQYLPILVLVIGGWILSFMVFALELTYGKLTHND